MSLNEIIRRQMDREMDRGKEDLEKWKEEFKPIQPNCHLQCSRCGKRTEIAGGADITSIGWVGYVTEDYRVHPFCKECVNSMSEYWTKEKG